MVSEFHRKEITFVVDVPTRTCARCGVVGDCSFSSLCRNNEKGVYRPTGWGSFPDGWMNVRLFPCDKDEHESLTCCPPCGEIVRPLVEALIKEI